MIRPLLATLAALTIATAPASAQIPGLREAAGGLLGRVPSLSSFLEGDPPITTSLDDARTEIAFLDGWSPSGWQRLDRLPRTGEGAFRLRPGRFAMEAQSYCMHAGTHGPGGGDGYLYAPLAGGKAGIVQSLLRNSVAHPEVPQRDIQTLIWAIIARTEFDKMPREMQRTARTLLTRDQVDDLDDGALGMVPESVMREAMNQLPPLARQVFEAEARLRSMISSGASSFAELERVAVLTGAVEPPEGSRPVPEGRWSFDPDGYFVRYEPSGYSRTRVQVSVPAPVAIGRDATGRLSTVIGPDGARLELGESGVRYGARGAATEALAAGRPAPNPEDRRHAEAAVRGILQGLDGARPVVADAMADLADLEALTRALRAAGVAAVGESASAPGGTGGAGAPRVAALDLLAEAWQAAFCRAAGCPSTGTADDVLVFRAGGSLRGALQGCAAETCTFGYASFERDAIEWIGLNRTDPVPPAAVHADVGEVHRYESAVRPGDLLGVSQLRVVTDRGGHDRPDVAWIHLVAGEEERAAEPPIGGPGPDDPPEEPRGDDEEDEPEDEPADEPADEPTFDASDDVATPGNRGRQRLAQSGRSSENGGDPAPGPEDDRCAGERRALHQAERMLELHDLQMQSLADRYSTLYDQLSGMQQEFDRLHATAEQEWSGFQNDVLFQAFQNILGAFLPIPPDQGSIAAAQSVIGLYELYTANSGTIADMRRWAQSNSGDHDLNDLLRMLDHMDSMYRTMGRMTQLKHEYDEMEVNREPLENSVEEARRMLEECLGAVG